MLVLPMLLLSPPRPLASPPGQDRRDLLPNMAHGLKPLLKARDLLLTHLLISVGNSGTNHVIGIRRASHLVPLPLCNDMFFICWPGKVSWKKWQNLRVRHCTIPYHIAIRHVCSPAGSPQSGSLRVWVRKTYKLHIWILKFECVKMTFLLVGF